MALFALLVATITAMITCFFSLAPGGFHGLIPWIGPRPSTPPASPASPADFFAADFWDSVPIIANVSVFPSSPPSPSPPPPPIFSFVKEKEEEPTAEELLRELWSLFREAVQRLTASIDGFFKRHPCLLTGKNPVCRLRPCWPFLPRVARSRRSFRARVRFVRAGSRTPPAPTPTVVAAAAAATAALTFSPSPSTSPAPLVSSPAPAFSIPVSPAPPSPSPPTPSTSPPSPLVSPLEHLHLINEAREQRDEILALEDKVRGLVAKLMDLQRVPPPTPPSLLPAAPSFLLSAPPCGQPGLSPGSAPPPLRPSAPSFSPSPSFLPSAPPCGQPGLSPGSAPPPLRPSAPSFSPPPSFLPSAPPCGQPGLSPGSAPPPLRPSAPSFLPPPSAPSLRPFAPYFSPRHVATPPPPPPQQRFGFPQRRPDLTPEEFFKQYPQTGTKARS